MTNDFTTYSAGAIVDWLSQGTQMATPPDPVYIALYDDTGSEVSGDLANGRVAVPAGTDWTVTGTAFDNANEIGFGEATADITVQEFALTDSATVGGGNELIRSDITSAPKTFSSGTRVFFPAGDLDVDILD